LNSPFYCYFFTFPGSHLSVKPTSISKMLPEINKRFEQTECNGKKIFLH